MASSLISPLRSGPALESYGRRLISKVLVQKFSDREDGFVLVGVAGDLNADGKTIGGPADRHDRGGRTEQIEPLGEAHGAEILYLPAFHLPLALAVLECGNTAYGGENCRVGCELFAEGGANLIRLCPSREQLLPGEEWFPAGHIEKVAKGGAQLAVAAFDRWLQQHAPATDEERPP